MSPIEKESESESHFKGAVFKGKDFYDSKDEIKGERYRVFHQASTGFSGTFGIRKTATRRANDFCRKMDRSKKMLTVSEHTAAPPYIMGNFPRIEIIFVCANLKNDQESKAVLADKYERISIIKDLLDGGALTQEEFDNEKREILSAK